MNDSSSFELRLADAFERYLVDAPTSVNPAAVASSVVGPARAQRRALQWPSTPTGRALAIVMVALLVLILVALGGGALQRDRSNLSVAVPTATPIASVPPSDSVLLPDALRTSTWIASPGAIRGLGATDPRIRLATSADGKALWILTTATGIPTLVSRSVTAAPGQIALVTTFTSAGCRQGDEAQYLMNPSPDGLVLTLQAVSDACATRRATLERGWTRDFDLTNAGGRGAIAFDSGPMLTLTLPQGTWAAGKSSGPAFVLLTSQNDRGLIAAHGPVPASGHCGLAPDGPARIEDFIAHLRTVPGFTVQATAEAIDGRPAALVTIVAGKTENCSIGDLPAGTAETWSGGGNARLLLPGESETFHLVEVASGCEAPSCADLYLLGYQGATTVEEQQVLASVTFTAASPSSTP